MRVPASSIRSVRAAITLAPHRFLLSAWPWRSLLYVLSGIVLGTVVFGTVQILAVRGTFTEGVLVAGLVVLVVVLVVPGAPHLARWAHMCTALVGPQWPLPDRSLPGSGTMARLRARLISPRLAREVAYAVLSLSVLFVIDMSVLLVGIGVPSAGVLRFAGAPHLGLAERAITVAGWIVMWPVGLYLVAAWSAMRSEIASAVLSPREERLAALLSDLSESRTALAEAFDQERRRIERDLHDGAQQRLVAVKTALGLARLDLPPDSPAHTAVAEAQAQVTEALNELRDLVRGIYPQVLIERGLRAAVLDVTARAPSPVEVDIELPERPPRAVESTAYFVVCEALANAAKHAPGAEVRIIGRYVGQVLRIEVTDTGPGGARSEGSGFRGLRARLAVVSGTVWVESPVGGPTTVRLEIPGR